MLRDGPKNFTQALKEKKKEPVEIPQNIHTLVDSDGEAFPPSEYHQVMEYNFGDAIQAALDSVTLHDTGGKFNNSLILQTKP